MEDDFLKSWFAGFDAGIEKLDETNLSAFLGECGKACSDSFPRKMYVEEYEKATDFDDFLKRIKSHMKGIDFEKIKTDPLWLCIRNVTATWLPGDLSGHRNSASVPARVFNIIGRLFTGRATWK